MDICWSLFPKFYQHLDLPRLADLVRKTGFDTTNMVIRDGYWVSPENMAIEVPAFVKTMEAEGLKTHFATAGFDVAALQKDDSPLAILADNGIREFRMGYFGVPEDGNVRAARRQARRDFQAMADLCERHDLRAVFQVHHTLLLSNASSVWPLIEDLPPNRLGVMLDPGNQSFEGYEDWFKSAHLLGTHLAAVGVKDTAIAMRPDRLDRPEKGWQRWWAPIYQGVTNWHEVIGALKSIDFKGTFVFMPFYDIDDPSIMTDKLKNEVAWLRKIVKQVESETPS